MTDASWAGSKWWKFDFHTHTPASEDYGKGSSQTTLKTIDPQDWLLNFMRAGVDCVAVTDHNSGAWIDVLKSAAAKLKEEGHADLRPLVLFPGVEISANGGIHVLALLDPSKGTSDVDSLLGAVGFGGEKGKCDTHSLKSVEEIAAIIAKRGGIAIPAHADGPSGLFELHGATLRQVLKSPHIYSMELLDTAYAKPALYQEEKVVWTEVLGSDSHHPTGTGGRDPGSRFTWVKMGQPSLEGLMLALMDADACSLCRSDKTTDDPNVPPSLYIRAIEVSDARYMGRKQQFRVRMNPSLNAIIGSRGTGKSTIVELLRLVLRRRDELPDSLASDFRKYATAYAQRSDDGLLTATAIISIEYVKDGTPFRVRYNQGTGQHTIEEKRNGGEYEEAEGDVRQRFPVRMYSQKQIFETARQPSALLGIIDDSTEVDKSAWEERQRELENQFYTLSAMIRENAALIDDEKRVKGELADVDRRLKLVEESGHSDIYNGFQRVSAQKADLATWRASWSGVAEQLMDVAVSIQPDSIDEANFRPADETDAELLKAVADVGNDLRSVSNAVEELSRQVAGIDKQWGETLKSSKWAAWAASAVKTFTEHKADLEAQGLDASEQFDHLVTRREKLELRLRQIAEKKAQIKEMRAESRVHLHNMEVHRKSLTQLRRDFLDGVLADNPYVQIEVKPFADRDGAEHRFRSMISREDGTFERDIRNVETGDGLIEQLFRGESDTASILVRLQALRDKVRAVAATDEGADVHDPRFASHLSKLPPEVLDRLDCWFPEDTLEVRYSPSADGSNFRPIREASPGQKTAALLAFLLSYDVEPIILDQPEDDLDNRLIYDLIVRQLRNIKSKRQVIVVTHNANIVVNGDAEFVLALDSAGGQTQQVASGSLQDAGLRSEICKIMEGGREAFHRRYRRISLTGL
ncbi:MAG: AAA family ATPase [Planctomycetes bacterium]|nr:AAA family ATPase [Planctomycetota bacterium]